VFSSSAGSIGKTSAGGKGGELQEVAAVGALLFVAAVAHFLWTVADNSCFFLRFRPRPRNRGRARCRMHGGAKGSGGPRGDRNGNFKQGLWTRENVAARKAVRAEMGEIRTLLRALRDNR
jgi:hypothetical protein